MPTGDLILSNADVRTLDWARPRAASLSPGKCADLIVLDRDIYRIPAHEIGGTRVLMTLLGGHEVHRAEGFDA